MTRIIGPIKQVKLPSKSAAQKLYLRKVFFDVNRPITKQLRKCCRERTGLTWPQIYKWLFDRRLIMKRKLDICAKNPLFKVTKVQRHARVAGLAVAPLSTNSSQ